MPRYAPVWSADSTRLLVIGRNETDKGLFEVTPGSGSVQHLPVPAGDPVYAEYMPDPARLLVVANRGAGRLAVTLYDRGTTPWTAITTLDDVSLAKLDRARNRILLTRASIPGLWQADLSLHGIAKISERPAFGGGRRLVITDDQVRLVAPGEGEDCGLQWIEYESQTGEARSLPARGSPDPHWRQSRCSARPAVFLVRARRTLRHRLGSPAVTVRFRSQGSDGFWDVSR